jgi:hypothetical protein
MTGMSAPSATKPLAGTWAKVGCRPKPAIPLPTKPFRPIFDACALNASARQAPPAFREFRQISHLLKLMAIAHVIIKQSCQTRQRLVRLGARLKNECFTWFRDTLFEDAVVPAGPSGHLDRPCHVIPAEALVEFPAGLATLADLQQGTAKRMTSPMQMVSSVQPWVNRFSPNAPGLPSRGCGPTSAGQIS